MPHAVAGVSTAPTIDDIHRHAWLNRSNTMAIYDDVVKGLWVDGSSGSCGVRRATAEADLENDPHATPQSCSAIAHRGPFSQHASQPAVSYTHLTLPTILLV